MALPSKKSFWSTRGVPRTSIRDVKDASKWFHSRADHEMSDLVTADKQFKGKRRQMGMPRIGHMYLWPYWAKHDKTLPTWDRFPLGFVFDITKKHFWALNFHYLPVSQRYQLGSALMKQYQKHSGNTRDYVKISYPIIKSVAKSKLYEPCVKQYLFTQLQGKFSLIHPDEWAMAVRMPVEKWRRGRPY